MSSRSERHELLMELAKELLGPRGGSQETLSNLQNPRDEYITGVLAPCNSREIEIDAQDEIIGSEEEIEDANLVENNIPFSAMISPSLDPRSLPRSIGLSFIIESDSENPTIEICATWARYSQNSTSEWARDPRYFLSGPVTIESHRWLENSDIEIRMNCSQIANTNYIRISIFLINSVIQEHNFIRTEELIFQPQIRISLSEGTNLCALVGSYNLSSRIFHENFR